jgi:hypothetical protein
LQSSAASHRRRAVAQSQKMPQLRPESSVAGMTILSKAKFAIGNDVRNDSHSEPTTNCCSHRRTFQTAIVMACPLPRSNFPHRFCACSVRCGERLVRDCSARNGRDAHKRVALSAEM